MIFRSTILSLCVLTLSGLVSAAEPLHAHVDRLIDARAAGQPMAGLCTNAEFLRRAYLDFAGDLPTAAETRSFISDPAADKRERLLDRLFAAPRFPERLADALNTMLMERRGENADWRNYLLEACRSGKTWDIMAREILAPDYADPAQKGAGYFSMRRLEKVGQQETDYPGLTRDAGRMFLGVDLQCCQCHNHLTVKSYKQADFNGLYAAFQNSKVAPPDATHKSPWLREGALTAKYDFVSVLTGVKGQTWPRVPFAEEVPMPEGDQAWLVKPDPKKKDPGVPRVSPLKEIAARVATKENPWFVRNIANRMWWLLMGRGLVEPLDLHNPANPPSNPELMDLLADELSAHDLSLPWLIKELAITRAYQRSTILPDGAAPAESLFAVGIERPLSSEQLVRAFLRATGEYEGAAAPGAPKGRTIADYEKAFRSAFANAPKEPELIVNPTLRSALFLRNNEMILSAMKPEHGNLVERLAGLTDARTVAEELYLSILTRMPTDEEATEVSTWLEKYANDRPRALGHYAWALISGEEFFSNH